MKTDVVTSPKFNLWKENEIRVLNLVQLQATLHDGLSSDVDAEFKIYLQNLKSNSPDT